MGAQIMRMYFEIIFFQFKRAQKKITNMYGVNDVCDDRAVRFEGFFAILQNAIGSMYSRRLMIFMEVIEMNTRK